MCPPNRQQLKLLFAFLFAPGDYDFINSRPRVFAPELDIHMHVGQLVDLHYGLRVQGGVAGLPMDFVGHIIRRGKGVGLIPRSGPRLPG